MKTIKKIYEKICSIENVTAAIKKASVGKRGRAEVQKVLADVPGHARIISDLLAKQEYRPCKYVEKTVREGSNGKERKIAKIAFFPDQVIHWAIVLQLQPFLIKSSYKYSCGCMPGRGVHYGKAAIEKWVRRDRKNTKYVAKLDIRKFYPSISHEKMKAVFRLMTSDKRLLSALDAVVESYLPGLPIGYLTSQWFSNVLLQRLDYVIKQTMQVKYYVRYMDDMVLFGANKKKLHAAIRMVSTYLSGIDLSLKKNWQVFPLEARPLDFMGFRFYRDKTTLRKSLLLRITRAARKTGKTKRPGPDQAASMLSYMGWVRRSQSYGVYKSRIAPVVSIAGMKKIVSEASKIRSRAHENSKGQQRISPV